MKCDKCGTQIRRLGVSFIVITRGDEQDFRYCSTCGEQAVTFLKLKASRGEQGDVSAEGGNSPTPMRKKPDITSGVSGATNSPRNPESYENAVKDFCGACGQDVVIEKKKGLKK